MLNQLYNSQITIEYDYNHPWYLKFKYLIMKIWNFLIQSVNHFLCQNSWYIWHIRLRRYLSLFLIFISTTLLILGLCIDRSIRLIDQNSSNQKSNRMYFFEPTNQLNRNFGSIENRIEEIIWFRSDRKTDRSIFYI